jgi:hypothetical protein
MGGSSPSPVCFVLLTFSVIAPPSTLEHEGAAGAFALSLAQVEAEKLGGPAQRPHDAEPDQRKVSQVLEVVGLQLAGHDLEILDEKWRGLIGLAPSLAGLASGTLEQALDLGGG